MTTNMYLIEYVSFNNTKVTYPLHRCCTSRFYSTELVYNQENIVPHLYVTCSGGVSGVIKETHLVGMWITQVYMANNPNTVLKHDYENKSINMDNGSVNKFKFFICVLINIKSKSINKMIPIAHLFLFTSSFAFLVQLNIFIQHVSKLTHTNKFHLKIS